MKSINYTIVPSVQGDGGTEEKWHEGKLIMLNEGHGKATVFLGHKAEETIGENGENQKQVRAFAVRVDTPVTRGGIINAAEMEAYGLYTAMDVASFNSSLARKSREDAEDGEVKEHDEFIKQVKQWLDEIGIHG